LKHPTLARLFKRDLFDNVEVYEQNIGIDEMLIVQLLAKSKKAVFVPTSYYNVTPNPNSVSRIKYTTKNIQEGIRIFRFICNFLELNNKKYAHIMDVRYLHYLLLINNIGYKNTELKKSREHLDAMNDLILFYNKAKNSQVFKHEPCIYKILFHSFVVCRPIYHFINIFLDLRKKLVGWESS
jgi:hypothetical protein